MAPPTLDPRIDIRPAGERLTSGYSWLDSKHSFAFGPHWDPANTHHGVLLVNNDDVVAPGAARLQPGETVELPDAPYLHLFVAGGHVALEGAGALAEGDAVRFTATGGQRVTAVDPAEILVWEMHAALAA